MIRLIVFDLGGVLVFRGGYREYLKKLKMNDGHYKKVTDSLLKRAMKGSITEKRMQELLAKRLGVPEATVYWPKHLRGKTKPNIKLQKIVRRLRKNYKVVLLSNMLPSRYTTLVRLGKHKAALFHRNFVSYRIRMTKPSKSAFLLVLRKMRMNPEETLFIDDLAANTRSARELGINAITFKDNKQLLQDLKKYDIK